MHKRILLYWSRIKYNIMHTSSTFCTCTYLKDFLPVSASSSYCPCSHCSVEQVPPKAQLTSVKVGMYSSNKSLELMHAHSACDYMECS